MPRSEAAVTGDMCDRRPRGARRGGPQLYGFRAHVVQGVVPQHLGIHADRRRLAAGDGPGSLRCPGAQQRHHPVRPLPDQDTAEVLAFDRGHEERAQALLLVAGPQEPGCAPGVEHQLAPDMMPSP
ncbi:hypothetical protein EJ357_36050 [Streptomyces cyaneochromogenes]|uniref:Uncharacterized protein n=1 Tax=Streptomyces cyaneochromogenes TaxID=2496836 RepID=A0A3S9MG94_9ACTN|nr:hypothetical protein [Streptomyces cyaneochromogenes]AZQ38199.1 hypothetical protein EJ357_36050 [Streptomyces cyaneochromogenes]